MMYVELFLTFLKIGAVSFGGGYGMIPLIKESVVANGWMTEGQLMNFIAVAESTPGPIAVNMATFVGSSMAGIGGAIVATIGVILPAFVIILCIAAFVQNFLKYAGVEAFLSGVRPCMVALIIGTAITMGLSTLFQVSNIASKPVPCVRELMILSVICIVSVCYKKYKSRNVSPILLIGISALLGIVLC